MLKIKDKKGIRDTFKALPELKEVHILANGDHYFNHDHAQEAAGEEEVTTLTADADELKASAKKEEPA